ncbi:putative glutathione S-transferase [Dorcoceras hygrometricum]|uniref:Probable glutathione S-transferase n=1 Tax=Dorcoceras hygrometricum TaxID=472368 RepID=A0A2Z7D615_9LAMI|nr:putative glutathione S-transferase [Dorcoceras hygrometricum]
MAEVKLLGLWGSPFSRRVEMALKLKGIEYEYFEEDKKNKSPLLLKYNPVHKKVPVLVHKGKPIAESLVILEYIDDTWGDIGPPILPKTPYERAMARFWPKFIDEMCIPTLRRASWSEGDEKEKAKNEAATLLKILDVEVKGKKFFGGETLGLVDIAAGFIACWFGVMEEIVGTQILNKDEFPNLCDWIEVFNNDNFVKQNLPPRDRLVGKYEAHYQAVKQARAA